MKLKSILKATVLCAVLGIGMVASADTAKEIQGRMKARLSQLETHKDNGNLGEDNTGYLQARTKDADAAKLAETENKDRKMIYSAIAAKTKTTAEQVGKRRAARIAEKGKAGQWYQDGKGNWFQKKAKAD